MFISTLKKRLSHISVFGRLYLLISGMVVLLVVELLRNNFSQHNTLLHILSLILITLGIFFLASLIRSINNGLRHITYVARDIANNRLHSEVKDYPTGETDELALSFNQIIAQLKSNNKELKLAEQKLIRERHMTETSEKAKQIFLVNISHEIRTPMNGILGFAKILEESLVEQEQKESMEMIMKSANQLMAILNDILDFSRLEAGDIDFNHHPFVLKDAIHSIYRLMEPSAKLKKLNFSYKIEDHVPQMVSGDMVRLGQILLNLTSNALKFTENGMVQITTHAVEELDDQVTIEFCVRDTGIGIPLNMQQRVFDFFEQVTNDTSRRYAGAGLGLSIVKRLVELQGGEVFLNSTVGKGSDFYFRLPFRKVRVEVTKAPDQTPAILQPAVTPQGKGIRILVVEDNPINQVLVIKLLERRGYETRVAENGRVALKEYEKENFDIILMDLQMPEMDGYEATRIIRKMDASKANIPIVAMTAHTIKGEFEKCASIGMNDYISKPFDSAELYQKIELLVENFSETKR